MQRHVNLVDLVKSFPTNIYLQNLASIQKRTSPVKFAHLAEKSGKGSISNLSTKVSPPPVLIRKTSPELIVSNLQTRRATCPQLFMHNYTLYANARFVLGISFFKHAMR